MSRPALNSIAETWYDGMIPFNDTYGVDGDATGWALANFVGWIGDATLQQVADYAYEGPNGEPGWSVLLDLARVPDEAVKYLAQFPGVTIDDSLSGAAQRAQIAALENQQRGAWAYFVSQLNKLTAAEGSATKGWVLRERRDPGSPTLDKAYHFQIIINTTNLSPSPDPTLAALKRMKPAGLVMHYSRSNVHDWQYVKDNNATWTTVKTTHSTWNDVLG